MKPGYWVFSPLEPKWSGVEPHLQGLADCPRGTFVHAPSEPARVSVLHWSQYSTRRG